MLGGGDVGGIVKLVLVCVCLRMWDTFRGVVVLGRCGRGFGV